MPGTRWRKLTTHHPTQYFAEVFRNEKKYPCKMHTTSSAPQNQTSYTKCSWNEHNNVSELKVPWKTDETVAIAACCWEAPMP
eukprot:749051-Amphidinium_carterae.1